MAAPPIVLLIVQALGLVTSWQLHTSRRAGFAAAVEERRLADELRTALDDVKTLEGLIPICASCKKVRDDEGFWHEVEAYVRTRSDAEFSHSICPGCMQTLYPQVADRIERKRGTMSAGS